MGFNDWNAFGCDVSDGLIRGIADALVATGLREAGYEYVNIDDCWSLHERDAQGRLVADPEKFPEGIEGTADYVHGLGLKLGLYADAGTLTCADYPGSLGYEEIDARTFAEWGVDYLKYDNCDNQGDGSQEDARARYQAMEDALDATGRPIVYSICEWGRTRPWEWAGDVGHLWRSTTDIKDTWGAVESIIAQNVHYAAAAGPGHWNDPDMLEVGNGGMTGTEYRTHFSMWAVMAAPLLIGTDLRTASRETLDILGNRDVIAVDQDPLGIQGEVVSNVGGLRVLDKPLADGSHAVALYNSTDEEATFGTTAAELGLPGAPAYLLKDLWTKHRRVTDSDLTATVPAHGTTLYRVWPLGH
ncbi:glycoside hydrolase family 27 protein [Streptomyces hoynatensis]|uniref:Alpha-galactosidase n=1 Tax=Streptomyces hoynatensis TaxID=1141874 RepID=A0A3A9YFH7_9ACTN|nr:glycoside hydrolase family 27 protein [Streptomyces hoynatensis]